MRGTRYHITSILVTLRNNHAHSFFYPFQPICLFIPYHISYLHTLYPVISKERSQKSAAVLPLPSPHSHIPRMTRPFMACMTNLARERERERVSDGYYLCTFALFVWGGREMSGVVGVLSQGRIWNEEVPGVVFSPSMYIFIYLRHMRCHLYIWIYLMCLSVFPLWSTAGAHETEEGRGLLGGD